MKVFCFHSVRDVLSIPPVTSWGDLDVYRMFRQHLIVNPDWFKCFILSARQEWGASNISVTFDDAYADVFWPALFSRSLSIRTIVFAPTSHLGGYVQGVPLRIMSSHELSWLLVHGVEIGSHGHRHLDWATLSEHTVFHELGMSQRELCDIKLTARQNAAGPYLLAPPHGSFTLSHVKLASDLQYGEIYGTLRNEGSDKVIKRCLADMSGYIEDENDGQISWPWS